jgi:hypothetical protein
LNEHFFPVSNDIQRGNGIRPETGPDHRTDFRASPLDDAVKLKDALNGVGYALCLGAPGEHQTRNGNDSCS